MLENDLSEDIRLEDKRPINDLEIPKFLPRLASGAIDLALYILLSFLILTIAGMIVGSADKNYVSASSLISNHIEYSKLAKYEEKNGYVSYNNDDLLAMEEDSPLIINRLSYFYLSYMTGNNLESGYEASLNKDDTLVVDSISYIQKEYYNVTFFNEKVLKLKEDSDGAKYFKYQETDGVKDESKLAIIDETYLEDVTTDSGTVKRLVKDNTLLNFLYDIYQEAIKVFYNQKAISAASKVIDRTNITLMFIASIPSFAVFYLLIPLLSPFGKSVGKYIFHLALVDDKGYLIKKWRILLRSLPILGATIYVCLINSLYFQLLVVILLLLISLGVVVFTSKRRALHDLMSGTVVIKANKDTVIYPDEEHYEQVLEILKQKKEAEYGSQQ